MGTESQPLFTKVVQTGMQAYPESGAAGPVCAAPPGRGRGGLRFYRARDAALATARAVMLSTRRTVAAGVRM